MIKRNHGHIVTMLGSTAVFGLGNFSDICTAKFGLVGFMESIDHELTLGKIDRSSCERRNVKSTRLFRRSRWYLYHSRCFSLPSDSSFSIGQNPFQSDCSTVDHRLCRQEDHARYSGQFESIATSRVESVRLDQSKICLCATFLLFDSVRQRTSAFPSLSDTSQYVDQSEGSRSSSSEFQRRFDASRIDISIVTEWQPFVNTNASCSSQT